MKDTSTALTRSGLFVRQDRAFGLLVYSPYTSLIYAVHEKDARQVLEWLETAGDTPVAAVHRQALGAGWAIDFAEADYPMPRLLSRDSHWGMPTAAGRPILVNWLLTGRCPLACKYCYADDLMTSAPQDPTVEELQRTADSILRLSPLVTVLTGGEPLCSPHLEAALELLSGRTGVMLDTSGYALRQEHVELLKAHEVGVRISLDSEQPDACEAVRPLRRTGGRRGDPSENTGVAALRAICDCLGAGLTVTVQTVATRLNVNDLLSLGDKLFRLGIRSWRILKIAPSETKLTEYRNLVGTVHNDGRQLPGKHGDGPYPYIFDRVASAARSRWMSSMAVQVIDNSTPNEVVLVSPDGRFYTESPLGEGKMLLDARRPRAPQLPPILRNLDMPAHTRRYLDLGTP